MLERLGVDTYSFKVTSVVYTVDIVYSIKSVPFPLAISESPQSHVRESFITYHEIIR